MQGLSQDFRYAARTLLKQPMFTTIAILTLALGIGANTTIFSIVNTVLLRPLAVVDSDRLMTFWHSAPAKGLNEVDLNHAQFAYYRDRTHQFDKLAAFEDGESVMAGAGEPESLSGARVTFNYFDVLGRSPLYGRTFSPDEDRPGKNQVVMLSYGLWQRKFGGDLKAIGQSIKLDNVTMSIVGIMPPDFDFPDPAERNSQHMQFWMPLGLDPQDTDSWNLSTVGRLKPGATAATARSEIAGLYEDFERDFAPRLGAGDLGSRVITVLVPLQERIVGQVRIPLMLLLGAIVLVLLIACANLANLLLARAVSRRRELALRHCLGASSFLIARQAVMESMLLAFVGAGAGLLFASWSVAGLRSLTSLPIPHIEAVRIDSVALLFTIGLTLVTTIVCGLAPALRSARVNLQDAIRGGARGSESRSSRRTKNAFVISQLALSLVLLIGSALLLQSLRNLLSVNPGFRAQNVLMAGLSLPPSRYTKQQAKVFYDLLLGRLRSVPGVQAAELCNVVPFSGDGQGGPFTVEGSESGPAQPAKVAWLRSSTPGYFKAMGMPILKGRSFESQDTDNSLPVVIVDETLVRMYWPNADPVGKRLRLGGDRWMTIVGVVPNVKNRNLDEGPMPYVYRPYTQWLRQETQLVVRTTSDPSAVVSSVRQQVTNLDPELPLSNVSTIEQAMARSLGTATFTNWLLLLFAAAAFVLAIIGIYGVMSVDVAGRTKEFGIRLALGARPANVLRIVLRQGMKLALLGVSIGIVASLALTRLMHGMLFGIKTTDAKTFVVISLLLMSVALLACVVPARRATRVDPLEALRYE